MVIAKEDNFLIDKWAGINTQSDPELIDDSELVTCSNFLIGPRGELVKRDARVSWTTLPSGNSWEILGQFFLSTGAIRTIIWTGNPSTKKAYYTDTDPTTPSTWTEITTLSGLNVYSAVQLNDAFYIATSAGVHKYITGTTSTLLASSPVDMDMLMSFQTQVFGFKGSRLYYTSIINADVWSAPGGFVDIYPGDGDNIKNIVAIGDRILIFKLYSTWILYLADDPAFWQVRGVNPEIGCTSKNAAKNIRGLIYFISQRGFWVTDGVSFTRLSMNIESMLSNRFGGNLANDGVCAYGTDYILLCFSSNFFAFRYVPPRGFTQLTSFGTVGNFKTIRSISNVDAVAVRNASAIFSFRPYTGPGGESIAVILRTKPWNVEDRVTKAKREKYALVGLGSQNSSLTIRPSYYWTVDDNDIPARDFPPKTKTGSEAMKIVGPGYGRTFQFVLTETSQERLEILWINLVGHLKRQQIEAAT
jgi:hypothetical protein